MTEPENKNRIIAGYEDIQNNEFWKVYVKSLEGIRLSLVNNLVSEIIVDEMRKQQGGIRMIDRILALPVKILQELSKIVK